MSASVPASCARRSSKEAIRKARRPPSAGELRMSTLEGYRRLVRLYLRPALGSTRVTDLTKQDVKRLHRKITATGKKVQANRVIALLSTMMSYAIAEELRADNPCFKAVAFNKELPRTRDITPEERGRLTAELAKYDNPAGRVLKLIMVTGARKSEVMKARWADIVLGDKPVWNRKAPDQKPRHDHTLVLNGVAAQLLKAIRDETITRDGQLVSMFSLVPARTGAVRRQRSVFMSNAPFFRPLTLTGNAEKKCTETASAARICSVIRRLVIRNPFSAPGVPGSSRPCRSMRRLAC